MTAARRLAAILVGGYKLGLGAIERPAPSRLRAELPINRYHIRRP